MIAEPPSSRQESDAKPHSSPSEYLSISPPLSQCLHLSHRKHAYRAPSGEYPGRGAFSVEWLNITQCQDSGLGSSHILDFLAPSNPENFVLGKENICSCSSPNWPPPNPYHGTSFPLIFSPSQKIKYGENSCFHHHLPTNRKKYVELNQTIFGGKQHISTCC